MPRLVEPVIDYTSLNKAKQYDAAVKQVDANPDYSYTLAAMAGDSVAANGLGHFTDAGKLPNHPTFSNESVLGNYLPSGSWSTAPTTDGRLGDVFTPSREQMAIPEYTDELAKYIGRNRGKGIDKIDVPIPYDNSKLK